MRRGEGGGGGEPKVGKVAGKKYDKVLRMY